MRYVRGQPVRRFERKPGARAEALDCATYTWAARQMVAVGIGVVNPRAPRFHRLDVQRKATGAKFDLSD